MPTQKNRDVAESDSANSVVDTMVSVEEEQKDAEALEQYDAAALDAQIELMPGKDIWDGSHDGDAVASASSPERAITIPAELLRKFAVCYDHEHPGRLEELVVGCRPRARAIIREAVMAKG